MGLGHYVFTIFGRRVVCHNCTFSMVSSEIFVTKCGRGPFVVQRVFGPFYTTEILWGYRGITRYERDGARNARFVLFVFYGGLAIF